MNETIFPPDPTRKEGFYPEAVYREALARYPGVVGLVREKARENGDKTWLTFQDGRSYTYRQVDELSDRLAAGLAGLGVRERDKVALFAYNCPEWILAYFAVLKAGAVPVTVNTGFIKDPLVYNLKTSDTRWLVMDARLLKAYRDVEERLDHIEQLVIIGDLGDAPAPRKPWVLFEELRSSRPGAPATGQAKDPCAMILTSGTTGPSKVVVDSNAQFISTALFMIEAGGITPDSVVYVYLPLFHIMALDLATLASLLANARMVLVEKFVPAAFWGDIARYGVTHLHAVGPILEILAQQPPSPLEREHGPIVALAYASKEIWETAAQRFNLRLTGGYGSTEVGIPVSSPYAAVIKGANPPGSCGRVGPHVEVRIMSDDGQFLPAGQTGEIVIRPRLPWTIFLEYYAMPEQTVEAFRGLWFHTGDAGYFNESGYLFFVDRLKDAIRRKGENISSYEVEQILLKNPVILEAAVVPAPSAAGEDEVMAVIVPKPGASATPAEILAWCRDNMPGFWVPRYLRVSAGLPRTATGRVEKFKLRAQGVTPGTWDRKKNG